MKVCPWRDDEHRQVCEPGDAAHRFGTASSLAGAGAGRATRQRKSGEQPIGKFTGMKYVVGGKPERPRWPFDGHKGTVWCVREPDAQAVM